MTDFAHFTHPPFRLYEGWYCFVEGKNHGPWPDKGSCLAGFETEKRRAEERAQKEVRQDWVCDDCGAVNSYADEECLFCNGPMYSDAEYEP